MGEKSLWLETDYFENFHCKGGACRNSCCEGWQIAVSMTDYFSLIGRECSPDLHHRLECAFRVPADPSPDRYRVISPNWLGFCPMHGEDGLCMLHRECGEQALPEICRVYPRSLKCEGGQNQACCSASCEAVTELLMDMDRLHFRLAELDAVPEYSENPGMQLDQIGRRCVEIVQDRSLSLSRRIGMVCALLRGGELAQAQGGLAICMNALEALRDESASLRRFGEIAFDRYAAENPHARENWQVDIRQFEGRFPRWEIWFENILANHMLYEDVPCADERLEPRDACAGLCLIYAAMRVICASYTSLHPSREDAADALAGIFRLTEHSPFYYNAHILVKNPAALLEL